MDELKELKLKVDPELEAYLPPLAPEVFEELEADIIEKGCQQPIKTWHGFIVDGHNRYRICLKHGIAFRAEEIDTVKYKDKIHVLIWMDENQIAKGRMLTIDELVRVRVRLVENLTKAGWKLKDSQHRIAEELGISPRTVARYLATERAIENVDPEVKEKLKPSQLAAMGHKAVKEFTTLSKPEQEDVIDRLGADPDAIAKEMSKRRKPKPLVAEPVVGAARPDMVKPNKRDEEIAAKLQPTKLGQDALHALAELNKRVMVLKKHLKPTDYTIIRQHLVQIDNRLVEFVEASLEAQGIEVSS